MNKILAIIKKELTQFFFSPIAYLIISCFILINSFLFYIILTALSKALSPPINPLNLIYGGTFFFWLINLVMVPAMTMRMGSEEKKIGTIETFLTAPISELHFVIGKFLAAFLNYVIIWLTSLIYVLVLSAYTKIDYGPIITSFIGVFLIGLFFTSIGIWSTMIAKNQIIAAILSFSVMTLIISMTFFSFIVPADKKEVINYIDLLYIMENFSKGMIDTKAVIYLISSTLLFIALTLKVVEARRWQ